MKMTVAALQSFLFVLTLCGFGFGGLMFYQAENVTGSAIHEIEALLGVLIGTIAIGTSAIVLAVKGRQ